jgi:hypothetical protein
MKKPTKAQRHEIYKKALDSLADDEWHGICYHIDRCSKPWSTLWSGYNHSLWPELLAVRPREGGGYWWRLDNAGNVARHQALLKMIALSAPAKAAIGIATKNPQRVSARIRSGKPGPKRLAKASPKQP